jgi:hypothetical protein
MKRVSVMGNESLLAAAITSRFAAENSPAAIHVTHHEFDSEDHRSLVMILEQGKPGSKTIFCVFYSSPIKTQEREQRDAANFIWAFCRV